VYWIVTATIYAEEHGIGQANGNADDMPDVNLFGDSFIKMFRDAINAVGNIGEIYERNLAQILPRGGRNTVNSVEIAGPQIYVPPGFL
jgi:hypothetical protein